MCSIHSSNTRPTAVMAPTITIVRSDWAWALPSFFPTPKVPEANPITEAKVDLGRFLFYDRRLSGNGTQACASCHQPARGFADGMAPKVQATLDALSYGAKAVRIIDGTDPDSFASALAGTGGTLVVA